jgi:hypothetical protein
MFSLETLIEEINSSGSDKQTSHNYCGAYYELFERLDFDNVQSFLEIGITNTRPENSSLHAWGRLFPSASVYGIDIAASKIFQKDNIYTYEADQSSILDLSNFMNEFKYPKFDIVLDDGSHVFQHARATFEYMIRHLKNDGLYMIEDVSKKRESWQQTIFEWDTFLSGRTDVAYRIIDTVPENTEDDSIVIGIWKV